MVLPQPAVQAPARQARRVHRRAVLLGPGAGTRAASSSRGSREVTGARDLARRRRPHVRELPARGPRARPVRGQRRRDGLLLAAGVAVARHAPGRHVQRPQLGRVRHLRVLAPSRRTPGRWSSSAARRPRRSATPAPSASPGWISYYCLAHRDVNPCYHNYHVGQLLELYRMTGAVRVRALRRPALGRLPAARPRRTHDRRRRARYAARAFRRLRQPRRARRTLTVRGARAARAWRGASGCPRRRASTSTPRAAPARARGSPRRRATCTARRRRPARLRPRAASRSRRRAYAPSCRRCAAW